MRQTLLAFAVIATTEIAVAGRQEPPTPPPATVRVGGDVRMPRKIRDVPPVYPPIAQSARVQGVVILETLVGIDGKVVSAKVLRSIPLLDQAALDAVKQWEFEPTRLNGTPVAVIVTTTVSFLLDSAKRDAPEVQSPPGASAPSSPPSRTTLGEALRNLQEYVRSEEFRHPQGQAGAVVQFDFKGTSLDPWLRRFIAQLKGNWTTPVASRQVVRNSVRFRVQRDGRISDVTLVTPSGIAIYDLQSQRTIASSSPAEPLPVEVKEEFLQFTVTFSYNEPPPKQSPAPPPGGNQPAR